MGVITESRANGAVLLLLAALLPAALAQYSHADGQRYVKYAAAAYCPSGKILDWNCGGNMCESGFAVRRVGGEVIYNSNTRIQAFVGYRAGSNEIIVGFRGTVATSLTNWASNLNADPDSVWSQCRACKVHSGFWNNYRSISSDLLRVVRNLRARYPSASLTFTGHSLGGAMAIIGAVDFRVRHGIFVNRVFTFGEPRAGNEEFAAYAKRQVGALWRITNKQDLIVHVPPSWTGFRHHDTEVFYSGSGFKVCGPNEDTSCSKQYKYAWEWKVSDHSNYVGLNIGSSACT